MIGCCKLTVRKTIYICILSAGFQAFSAYAQTVDGVTPARETGCDALNGQAYGLCVAYCEAQDCDVNPEQPSCEPLRINFERRTGSPVFPCDPRCGDGIVHPTEVCDDGNLIECDGCSNSCQIQNPGDPGCEPPQPPCTPGDCGSMPICNIGGSCLYDGVCGRSAEGPGFCLDGGTGCAGLVHCNTTAECPSGGRCLVLSCCRSTRAGVCIPASALCSPYPGLTQQGSSSLNSEPASEVFRSQTGDGSISQMLDY